MVERDFNSDQSENEYRAQATVERESMRSMHRHHLASLWLPGTEHWAVDRHKQGVVVNWRKISHEAFRVIRMADRFRYFENARVKKKKQASCHM